MRRSSRRTAGLAAATVLAGLVVASAGAAQEEGETEAGAPSITVELLSREDSGVHGIVRIYSLPGGHAAEGEEQGSPEASGGLHPHRFVVELRGLEAGRSHPVFLHHGRCDEGGPALLPLESVEAGEDGSGASRTVLTAEEMMTRMREAMEGEGGEASPHGAMHPPFFIQARGPDGVPAACGNLYLEGGGDDGAVVTLAAGGEAASPGTSGT